MKKILSFFIGLGIALTAGCQESPDAAESLFGLSRLMGSRIFAISAGYQTADVCFRLASSGQIVKVIPRNDFFDSFGNIARFQLW